MRAAAHRLPLVGVARRLKLGESVLLVTSILVGVAGGLAAVTLMFMLDLTTELMLGGILNLHIWEEGTPYVPKEPEGARPWVIPLVVGLGGLVSGLLVYSVAPEAEGHGTDAALDAIHNRWGRARLRVPAVKIVASSITIGAGGSGGREGPIAQSGAGVAYLIARAMGLGRRSSRLMAVAGLAAGIGAIFRTPLGGALFAVEVLYKRDFEAQASVYAVIASITGYVAFSSIYGYGSIFVSPAAPPGSGLMLVAVVIGLLSPLLARSYIALFYRTAEAFRRLPLPRVVKPFVGGLLTGCVAFLLWLVDPRVVEGVLSTGYAAVQAAIDGAFPWHVLLAIALLKPLTTSLTIGSGGSAGVFGPSVVIGATFGAAVGKLVGAAIGVPEEQLGYAAIIGIAALVSGVCKTPLAAVLMAAEMTGGYLILPSAAAASALSYALSGLDSIYSRQLLSRERSPAYALEHAAY